MPRTYGKKKQQTRLTFAPIVETSSPPPGEADAFHSSPRRLARIRYSHPSSSSSSKRDMVVKGQLQLEDYSAASKSRRNVLPASSSSDEGQAMTSNTPTKSRQRHSSSSSSPHSVKEEHGESSSEGEVVQPSKRRRPFTIVVPDDSESDQKTQPSTARKQKRKEKDTTPKITKSSRLRGSSKKADDTDQGEYSAPKTRSVLGMKRQLSSSGGSPPRKKSLLVDLTELAESETSDADALVTAPPSSRKRKTATPKKAQDLFVVEDDDSESDIVPVSRKRDTPKAKQKIEDGDDDSSDDVVTSTPARRMLRRSPHTPRGPPMGSQKTPLSRQDELDIQEDLEDLMDTAVKQSRTRGAPVNSERSKRQRHLDLLRRRRAGEKDSTDANEEEESDDEDDHAADDSSDAVSFPKINIYDYHKKNDDDSDVESEVNADEDLDQDDASFVDADDDDKMGVPAASVPFEFSRHRTKQPRQCFRDVVEWMVHNKLNPAFERHDDIYQFAFRKLDDEVVGRAGSQLISSVWNTDFCNALRARPYIDVTSFPVSDFYNCAACNRTNHPASSDIRLFGEPYSEETLEPLVESDEDDEEEDDEEEEEEEQNRGKRPDRDREGNPLPPEDRHFYLGKHCQSNAVLTHTLLHWRFNLYEWVVDYLDAKEGFSDPQRTVDRENLSRRKRAKMANKVVDTMDKDGEIQRLWRDFHNTLKVAREKTG